MRSPNANNHQWIWRNVFEFRSTMYHNDAPLPMLPIDNNHHHHSLSTFTPTTAAAIVRRVNKCPSKYCALDPWPTTLLKTNINSIAPVLANIINMSLKSATVPAEMKHALVTPMLKKTCLDVHYIKNYRPISNISFVSKLLDRYAAVDLRRYIDENKLLDPFQSAYRPHYSIETALVHIYGDIMQALDGRKGVILILLDLTAAINTLDHGILLKQMKYIGICESVLNMLLRLRMPFLADNN